MADPGMIQRQALNNSEDLQFFIRDLKQWEDQMKKLDKKLLASHKSREPTENSTTPSAAEPPIRSGHRAAVEKSTTSAQSQQRISSFDYAAWDKFDVEKACQENNEFGHGGPAATAAANDDDGVRTLHDKQAAILAKEKGNRLLKEGKLDEAVACYTEGYTLDPTCSLLPANRALARLKQGRFSEAEEDCDLTLVLDPTYVKAYQRRAAARMGLGKFASAKDDLLRVLKFEPNNKETQNELLKLEKKQDVGRRKGKGIVEVVSEKVASSKTPPCKAVPPPPPLVPDVNTLIVEPPELPPVTSGSSYQFQADFRRLRAYPALQNQYLCRMHPINYPQVFQDSLESDTLANMLVIFRDYYIDRGLDVYDPLYNIAQIKRFAALRMFLSSDDKATLRLLFDYIRRTRSYSDEELQSLMAEYHLAFDSA